MDSDIMAVELKYDYDAATSAMDTFNQRDIDELSNWTKSLDETKLVPKNLTNKQLVIFYNACYGDIEKSKQCIENYYNCRKISPEVFNNRIFSEQDRKTLEVVRLSILPGKSCEGDDIVYYSIYDGDYKKLYLESASKLILMTVDLYLSTRGPQPGYMFVIDARGVRFMHLTRLNLTIFRKLFQYLQTAMPVRFRAVHMLNASPVVDRAMKIVKPFMDKKFLDMVHIHRKNEDLEVLYKIIPKSSLPSDYGGLLPDINTLHEENIKQLQLLEPYFKAEEKQRMKSLTAISADISEKKNCELEID